MYILQKYDILLGAIVNFMTVLNEIGVNLSCFYFVVLSLR